MTRGHTCPLPTHEAAPGDRFTCPVCDTVWVNEPFQRLWRYLGSPASMALRWVATLVTFRTVDLIAVGWKKKRNLDVWIGGHWVLVALHSLAAGSLILW